MPFKAAISRITAWSYSRWRDYEKCPAFAKYKHVDKMKEPGNAVMERGSAIHKLAENYAGGRLKTLPAELKLFKVEFAALKKSKPKCEQDWAFTKEWGITGWFDPDAWLRVKVDAAYEEDDEGIIIDHKTGKVGEYNDQAEIYAIAALLVFRGIKQVHVKFWYLDQGEEKIVTFKRSQLEDLKKLWIKKSGNMLKDTKFPPRPGNYCRWCIFSKAKGGPCQF